MNAICVVSTISIVSCLFLFLYLYPNNNDNLNNIKTKINNLNEKIDKNLINLVEFINENKAKIKNKEELNKLITEINKNYKENIYEHLKEIEKIRKVFSANKEVLNEINHDEKNVSVFIENKISDMKFYLLKIMKEEYNKKLHIILETKTSESKVDALNYGRELASYTRELYSEDPSITLFDEVALQNDINAYGG